MNHHMNKWVINTGKGAMRAKRKNRIHVDVGGGKRRLLGK